MSDDFDFVGREIRPGDLVAFAVIGRGADHGGALADGVIEEIDGDDVVLRNTFTDKLVRRPAGQVVRI